MLFRVISQATPGLVLVTNQMQSSAVDVYLGTWVYLQFGAVKKPWTRSQFRLFLGVLEEQVLSVLDYGLWFSSTECCGCGVITDR